MGQTREETALRHKLKAVMGGLWTISWIEAHDTAPGIPDLTYLMHGDGYESGWLELKAERDGVYRFEVRPTQHDWIRARVGRIPIHLLAASGGWAWLIDGRHHEDITQTKNQAELDGIAIASFDIRSMRTVLSTELRRLTLRSRKDT